MRRSQDLDVRQQSAVADASSRRPLYETLAVVGSIVALDQATKRAILNWLDPGPCSVDGACYDIVGSLRLNIIFNPGASFGTGEGLGPLIGVISFAMAGVMLWLAPRTASRLQRLIFSSIAGGALGNGLDRLLRAEDGFLSGEVIDFIDLQWWPVFNVADCAIVIAVVVALATSFLSPASMGGEPSESAVGLEQGDEGTTDS